MAFITRVSRLFRADLHAVLDRIEEPDVLLRQAVRDMEEEFAQEQRRCTLLSHERALLSTREADLKSSLDTIETELDVCFESQKESLARTLIRRKLEAQRLLKALSRKRAALETDLSALNTRIHDNQARLDNLRQKAELLAEYEPIIHAENTWETLEGGVAEADVEVAFLREQQNRRPS